MRNWFLLILGGVFMLFQGCVSYHRYNISAPYLEERSISDQPGKGILTLSGLEVSVKPYNDEHLISFYFLGPLPIPIPAEKYQRTPSPPFYIEICFYPVGSEAFMLDPFNMLLDLGSRGKYLPIGYFGPEHILAHKVEYYYDYEKMTQKDHRYARLHYSPSFRSVMDRSYQGTKMPAYNEDAYGEPIEIEPSLWTCVLLEFEVMPPPPAEKFKIFIDGVSKVSAFELTGKSIPLSPIYLGMETIGIKWGFP